MPSMAQFDLDESVIVTMDEQADIPCEHGVVHVVPVIRKWLCLIIYGFRPGPPGPFITVGEHHGALGCSGP